MKFSVLLSLYNKENPTFLDKSLDSILTISTIKPNEVILVKDGFINNKLEIVLKKYKNKFSDILKIIGYKNNKGLGFALNYGLKHCSNNLVFRMDTDDISHKDRFKIQLNVLKKNPDIVILGSNIEEFNFIIGDLKRRRLVPITSNEIQKNKLLRNPFNHMTVVFKKNYIIRSGGYKDMPGYEDHYLWLRLLKNGKGLNIYDNLVYARVGNNLLSRRRGIEFFLKEFNFQKTLFYENHLSLFQFINNVILRCIPRLFPKWLLSYVYKKFLRK